LEQTWRVQIDEQVPETVSGTFSREPPLPLKRGTMQVQACLAIIQTRDTQAAYKLKYLPARGDVVNPHGNERPWRERVLYPARKRSALPIWLARSLRSRQ